MWSLSDPTRFNTLLGPLIFRIDDGVARVRMTPEHRHSNLSDNVHGGALLGFIDVALFAAARGHGLIVAGTAVTLDLNTQFIGGARIGAPIEARVELLAGRAGGRDGGCLLRDDPQAGTVTASPSPLGATRLFPLPAGEGRSGGAAEGRG